MPSVERSARECLNKIKQRLGLGPTPHKTPEDAIIGAAVDFLEGPYPVRSVLNLQKPEEEKTNNPNQDSLPVGGESAEVNTD